MEALDLRKRGEDTMEILKKTSMFDGAILELKRKNRTARQRLLREIDEAKTTFPPQGLAYVQRATALAENLRMAEKEFFETKSAYLTAALQASAYNDKFEGEINFRQRELAKLSDERIKHTIVWLESLDNRAKEQLRFWILYARDSYGRQAPQERSSGQEVEEARAQLRKIHAAATAMLYADYGDDPLQALLKIHTDAERVMKQLGVDPVLKPEFDEISFHKEIPTVKLR
jgi:hypothetical protein